MKLSTKHWLVGTGPDHRAALRRPLLPARLRNGKILPSPFPGRKDEVENYARPHPCLLAPGEGALTARVTEFTVKWLARRGHGLFPLQGRGLG